MSEYIHSVVRFKELGCERFTFYKRPCLSAFSLVELLIVIAIMALLAGISVPAMRALSGAGDINTNVSKMVGYIEVARAHAIAQSTYVRIGILQVPGSNPPEIIFYAIHPAYGNLRDDDPDGADGANWPTMGRSLTLKGMSLDMTLLLAGDVALNTPTGPPLIGFTRSVNGTNRTFATILQINPNGEISHSLAPIQTMGVGFVSPSQPDNRVMLRFYGASGRVEILREEHITALGL